MVPPEPSPEDSADVEGTRMTLGEHLDELRRRLIHSAVALAVAFSVLYSQRHEVFEFIQGPHRRATAWLNEAGVEHWHNHVLELQAAVESARAEPDLDPPTDAGAGDDPNANTDDEDAAKPVDPLTWFESGYPERKVLNDHYRVDESLSIFSPDGGFVLRMRICFWLSLFVAGPYIIFEIWRFIAAGLYKHERKVVHRYVPWSVALFLGGVTFGYMLMVPYALYFLGLDNLGQPALNSATQVADQYLQFLKALAIALGFVFQLPVFMLALARLEIVEAKSFAHYRRHTIVGALVLAAVLTPPDPITQMMMAGPVVILYEVGLWLARASERKRAIRG